MAISAPLNGASQLGETFAHNIALTADPLTIAATLSVGDTLLFMAAAGAGGQSVTALSQTGVRWVSCPPTAAALYVGIWYGTVTSASASATLNVTTAIAGTAMRYTVTRHTGVGLIPTINATAHSTATSATMDATSVSPTAAFDYLVVAVGRALTSAVPLTPSAGFTALNSNSNGYYYAYQILTAHSGAAVNCAFTWTGGAAVQWEAQIIAFRVTPSVSAGIDTLVAVLDPADQTPAGKVKIARDCRVTGLTATEPGVNIVAGQAHRWNDYRLQSSALDAIGGGGVDASGYSLVGTQGTGTEYLHGNGAQWMASTAAISTLDLSAVTGYTIIDIVRVTGNGGVGGIARDPLLATAPYCMNAVESGTYKMASNQTTSVDTGVASGATWRIIFTQRYNIRSGVAGMTAINSGDQMHHVAMGGRVPCPQIWGNGLLVNSGVTYASGNNYDVMGRQSTNIATIDHAFHAVINSELTAAQRLAVEAWAVTNFGVTLDTSLRTLIPLGASFTWGASQAGAQLTDPPLKYAVTSATGGGSTFAARGWEARPFALSNFGVSGRNMAHYAEGISTTVLQAMNSAHPGRNLFVVWDVCYNSMKTLTAAQGEAALISLLTQIQAVGGYTLIATVVDGGYQYTGFTALGNASGISAQGTETLAFNALLRANWATYPNCVGLVDLAADINLKPDKWAGVYPNTPACAIGTYYEGGQGGHFLNAGYQYIGQLFADYINANTGTWSGGNSSSSDTFTFFARRLLRHTHKHLLLHR